ncbi:MAG: universal stress protein [Halobacteriales archaeon]
MTFMVPFDGSALAEAALVKAHGSAVGLAAVASELPQLAQLSDPIDVVAVSVIPDNARYARRKGWIDPGETFQPGAVVDTLRQQVADLVPSAEFQSRRVDRGATAGTISGRLRRTARDLGATMVFIGSDNAGRIVTPITSIGGGVTAGDAYDVCIVRHPLPDDIEVPADVDDDDPRESWFQFPDHSS